MCRKILLARPANSPYSRPLTLHLFYKPKPLTDDPAAELSRQEDLILDFPGGGFIAMTPEHHDERLRRWAVKTGKPIISVDYGKAPECTPIFLLNLVLTFLTILKIRILMLSRKSSMCIGCL